MSKLILKDVSKSFGSTIALSKMNISIENGSLVTLVGPSGCGKTTALRIVAGLTKSDSGEVFFDSTEISKVAPAKRDIGMVFQAYSLFPNMTARENVEFGLQTRKLSRVDIARRIKEIFAVINLESHMDRYPHQLSGGQQQRIALARAIVVRPKVLLLDEPLSALDAQVRLQLRDEIRRVQKEFGITTLFVTHDQEEAMTISDRVGVMDSGKLIQFDAPQRIYSEPANSTVAKFIGVMNEIPGVVVDSKVELFGKRYIMASGSDLKSDTKEVLAMVRPEAVVLTETGEADTSGRVTDISFLGPISTVRITLDTGLELKSTINSSQAGGVSVGNRVGISLKEKSILVRQR